MRPYYEHAGVTIFHGDCREVLPLVSADVLVTDPPYGIRLNLGRGPMDGVGITGDCDTSARDAVLAAWGGGPAIVFGTWRVPRPANTRAILIWDKGGAVGMGDLSFPWKPNFEEIYVLGDGFAGRRDNGVLSIPALPGEAAKVGHPTPKPVELMVRLLTRCPPGVVLDPFMGSGTTLRAAKDLGRRAIGIEIEERYCEVAAKRLSQEVLPLVAP